MPHNSNRLQCFAACLIAVLLLAPGCERSRGAVNAQTQQIPLKVWRFLAPGESPGSPSNRGCRLTDADVQAFVAQLQSNAVGLYGGRTQFLWDQAITDFVDGQGGVPRIIPTSGSREINPASAFWTTLSQRDDVWTANVLNVYFVGRLAGVNAFTVDPALADCEEDNNPLRQFSPMIVYRDGGDDILDGWDADRLPAIQLAWHVLEHEMTHYLGRFKTLNSSTCAGLAGRSFSYVVSMTPPISYSVTYDTGEHVTNMTGHILRTGGAGPGAVYTLFIPGSSTPNLGEKGELWQRINLGCFNCPN